MANGHNIKVYPPDLLQSLISLAYGVQKVMASLHDLQLALTSIAVQTGDSKTLLDRFQDSRDIFKDDWISYNLFLRHSSVYADNYVYLCEYSATRPAWECLTFSKDVLDIVKSVHSQAHHLSNKQHRTYKEFHGYMDQSTSKETQFMSGAGKQDEVELSVPSMQSAILIQFIRTAEEAPLPDAIHALAAINAALMEIHDCLQDMTAFWDNEVHRLAGITSQSQETFRAALDESDRPREIWKEYQLKILATSSSITKSSDALIGSSSSQAQRSRTRAARQEVRPMTTIESRLQIRTGLEVPIKSVPESAEPSYEGCSDSIMGEDPSMGRDNAKSRREIEIAKYAREMASYTERKRREQEMAALEKLCLPHGPEGFNKPVLAAEIPPKPNCCIIM